MADIDARLALRVVPHESCRADAASEQPTAHRTADEAVGAGDRDTSAGIAHSHFQPKRLKNRYADVTKSLMCTEPFFAAPPP